MYESQVFFFTMENEKPNYEHRHRGANSADSVGIWEYKNSIDTEYMRENGEERRTLKQSTDW